MGESVVYKGSRVKDAEMDVVGARVQERRACDQLSKS